MTENEAIKFMKLFREEWDKNSKTENAKALDIAIQALEKQIPKRPIKSEEQPVRYVNTYYCPVCRLGITGTNIAKWCYHCGQKLDWSDEE